jgi:hypothetical protein
VDCSEDVAVVGHGGGGLADFAEVAGEFVYVAGAIEKGVIGVEMKVGKLCCHAPILGVGTGAFAEDKWGRNSLRFLPNTLLTRGEANERQQSAKC